LAEASAVVSRPAVLRLQSGEANSGTLP